MLLYPLRQMFDTDHSGEIDEDEFAMLLEYLGIELSEEEMEKMFKRFDTVSGRRPSELRVEISPTQT